MTRDSNALNLEPSVFTRDERRHILEQAKEEPRWLYGEGRT